MSTSFADPARVNATISWSTFPVLLAYLQPPLFATTREVEVSSVTGGGPVGTGLKIPFTLPPSFTVPTTPALAVLFAQEDEAFTSMLVMWTVFGCPSVKNRITFRTPASG